MRRSLIALRSAHVTSMRLLRSPPTGRASMARLFLEYKNLRVISVLLAALCRWNKLRQTQWQHSVLDKALDNQGLHSISSEVHITAVQQACRCRRSRRSMSDVR